MDLLTLCRCIASSTVHMQEQQTCACVLHLTLQQWTMSLLLAPLLVVLLTRAKGLQMQAIAIKANHYTYAVGHHTHVLIGAAAQSFYSCGCYYHGSYVAA
jgi:hypothetical protein